MRWKKSFTNFAEEVKEATNSSSTSPYRKLWKLWKVRMYVSPCRGLLLVVLYLFLGLLECADTEH